MASSLSLHVQRTEVCVLKIDKIDTEKKKNKNVKKKKQKSK